MKTDKVARRTFLRGAGALTLSLPFLGSLSRSAEAAGPPGGTLRRAIFFFVPYGTIQEEWFPADTLRAAATRISERAVEVPWSSIPGDPSPVFQRSMFGDFVDKMLLLDGIDGPYGIGHQKTFPLTGYVRADFTTLPGMSIDQIIAQRAQLYPSEPAFRSLHLAAGVGGSSHRGMSYGLNGSTIVPVPEVINPTAFHDAAFAAVVDGTPEARARFEQTRADRLSVIDLVIEDYQRLMASPNLSATDRQRVDAYLTYLRQHERSTTDWESIVCDAGVRPDLDGLSTGERALRLIDAQVDNIVHAVRCDLSRVITFNVESTTQGYPGIPRQHHTLSHNKDHDNLPGSSTNLDSTLTDQIHIRALARLVGGLDVEEDPGSGRTYLDNSVILLCSNMGSVYNHKGPRLPCAIFGGRDHFKSGRIVDFRTEYEVTRDGNPRRAGIGISYNNILITICQAMGLTPEDYEQGQAGIGAYHSGKYYYQPFPGGIEQYEEHAYGDRRSPLAELLA